jgi:hypothetical protein
MYTNRINALELKKSQLDVSAAKAQTRAAQRQADARYAEIKLLKLINRNLMNSVYDLRQHIETLEQE